MLVRGHHRDKRGGLCRTPVEEVDVDWETIVVGD